MPLPNWAQAELIARESGDPIIALVTLTHPSWATPQRLACNTDNVISQGNTFEAAAFEIEVVSDDDGPAKARLAIPNVDRRIGLLIRQLTSRPECMIEVIALSHPDEPIYTAARLEVDIQTIGAVSVQSELRGKDFSTEPCGTKRVIPKDFPAFFR